MCPYSFCFGFTIFVVCRPRLRIEFVAYILLSFLPRLISKSNRAFILAFCACMRALLSWSNRLNFPVPCLFVPKAQNGILRVGDQRDLVVVNRI